jgi:hypothetical protein
MAAYMAEILRGQSHAELIGPIADAGGENGLVLRGGEVVEEWGDTERVDMCFSVAKSFLSAVAGLAFDRVADRRPSRAGRRRPHHLAPPAPADEAVGGDALGQAHLLRSRFGRRAARPARQRLGLQRRARKPAATPT